MGTIPRKSKSAPPWLLPLRRARSQCRDFKVRRRIELFLRVHEVGSVSRACRELQQSSRYYYFWWRRFQEGGFKVQALQERSRRPHRVKTATAPHVVEWIRRYREEFHYSLHEIQRALLREPQVRVSLTTIYRVLEREKVQVRRRRKKGQAARAVRPARNQPLSAEPKPTRATHVAPSVASEPTTLVQGRYQCERELGRGAGGVVYLARDTQHGDRRVALKFAEIHASAKTDYAKALRNEFEVVAALRHPYLAQVLELGCEENAWHLASQYVDGVDLVSATRGANLNIVFQLLVQILRALDFLHRKGVLHLDLKPGNILVTDPDRTGELSVKLIDFGNAAWRRQGKSSSGDFVGTLPYAAPEMMLEQEATPASDIYSLGMLMHQIFTGGFPFSSQDPVVMMEEQLYGQAQRPAQLDPALPEGFADLLHRMVARDPAQRWPSPAAVLAALNDCLGEQFSLQSGETPVGILDQSERSLRPRLAAELSARFFAAEPGVVLLSGAAGLGKSRLLRRLKEALQLRGSPIQVWQNATALETALRRGEIPTRQAILLEDPNLTQDRLVPLLDDLEGLAAPALVATRLSPSWEIHPALTIELAPLSYDEMNDFLREEILEFPAGPWVAEVLEFSGGQVSGLEEVLQAWREAGMIQWSDLGWRWTAQPAAKLPQLLSQYRQHWSDRLQRVQELLNLSKLGLRADALDRILGLEPGSLASRLAAWETEGKITGKGPPKDRRYFGTPALAAAQALPADPDWQRIAAELEKFYDAGNFAGGVAWAEQWAQRYPEREAIPTRVRLFCARHSIAAGHAEEAKAWLPTQPLGKVNDRALAAEIQARILWQRGDTEQTLAILKGAEQEYGQAKDALGLSRVLNLRGSAEKKSGRWAEAEEAFTAAIQAGARAQDALHEGFATMNLANLRMDRGDWELAEPTFRRALQLAELAQHPSFSCRLRENWLNLLFQSGRSAEVENVAYELLRLALQHHYPEQQAAALNYLALLAGQKNLRQEQLDHLRQALGILNPRRSPQVYYQTLMNRGFLSVDLGRFAAAQLDAEETLTWAERHSNPPFLAWANLLLGILHRDRPKADFAAASRYLNEAHRHIYTHQIRPLLWEIEYERGLLAKQRQDFPRARHYFIAAQRYLDSLLLTMPEAMQKHFLRDRKHEKLSAELRGPE